MAEEQRRLAAVMFTDMVGYTAITNTSEAKAMSLLDEQRSIVRENLQAHGGREVKTIGDAFLAEFASALSAVECAAEIQRSIGSMNVNRARGDQIHLRIGLHLGEVLERNGDIYGDAVNVASRIHALAPEDGICISGQVYENVVNKTGLKFEGMGRHELKNVQTPVTVYRIAMSLDGAGSRPRTENLPANRVAVLPFVNISPDPADEYFADGLTEELISKLSQVGGLKVIARTSVMNYKRKEKNAAEIGSELGAGTLVEGSVRKAGGKIRVSVQVIDSNTEEHKWATTYDRSIDDIFAVQSDIASKVTESLPRALHSEMAPRIAGDTKNVEAYTFYMKARQLMRQPETGALLKRARELFAQSVELDPQFARGWVGLARAYARLGLIGSMTREESRAKADGALERAFEIYPDLPEAHAERGLFAWFDDDFPTAEKEERKAIELNPNLAESYENLSLLVASMGDLPETVRLLEKVRELDPLSPMVGMLGQMYLYSGREEDALKLWSRIEELDPVIAEGFLAEYHIIKGDLAKATEFLDEVEKLNPNPFFGKTTRGMIAALKGDREEALKISEDLRNSSSQVAIMPNFVAYIYYLLGDLDLAFEWLNKAVDAHSLIPMGIRFSPLFARLRKDPRYRQLLIKNGLKPENVA